MNATTPAKRGPKPKRTAVKYCKWCGARMERRYWSSGRVETVAQFRRRKFCSLYCACASQPPAPPEVKLRKRRLRWMRNRDRYLAAGLTTEGKPRKTPGNPAWVKGGVSPNPSGRAAVSP